MTDLNSPEFKQNLKAMENLGMTDISNIPQASLVNDLRLRVLEGWDPPAEVMLQITNQIRQNRRSAAARSANAVRKSVRVGKAVDTFREDLKAVLDQEME